MAFELLLMTLKMIHHSLAPYLLDQLRLISRPRSLYSRDHLLLESPCSHFICISYKSCSIFTSNFPNFSYLSIFETYFLLVFSKNPFEMYLFLFFFFYLSLTLLFSLLQAHCVIFALGCPIEEFFIAINKIFF